MSFLETNYVGKCFREGSAAEVWALRDVSLAISKASFTVLTGPSGSGKTTLLALLGALDRPSRGQVLLEGRNLTRFSDVELARVRRRMGFVFQNFALIPMLPIWENITYPLIPRAIPRAERYRLAQSLLSDCGMADKILKRPDELSAGEQQRVAVARAVAGQPEVLLADEPTSNLDRSTGRSLILLLQGFRASGKTVIVASHDAEVVSLADEVYELELGRLKSRVVSNP